jgi:putative oxidoreductase
MRLDSIKILRICLGIVFLWFGALKLFGVSPVTQLIAETYSFLDPKMFLVVLGVWEVVIGLGLLFNFGLKWIIPLLWLQMAGTFFSAVLNPSLFFIKGNILEPTYNGEFLIKNLVLVAGSLVIWEKRNDR